MNGARCSFRSFASNAFGQRASFRTFRVDLIGLIFAGALAIQSVASAAVEDLDTLDKAVAAPFPPDADFGRTFKIYGEDQESWDSNVFRLPSNAIPLGSNISLDETKADHVNTSSVGLDGKWTRGRQMVAIDLRADMNRFANNVDLNNVSANDKLVWNWQIGSVLSGQFGSFYSSSLASFVNSNVYSKNVVSNYGYYGSARYQVGPHWAVFAGALHADTTLSANASKENNNHNNLMQFGTELATNVSDSLGVEYRINDVGFPHGIVLNGISIFENYREETARLTAKYAMSDKTTIEGNFGYLKRSYSNAEIGSFSGDAWHFLGQWRPSDKTLLAMDAWRRLQAYLTAQSAYFVSQGVSVAPTWLESEKLKLALQASLENQDYVGTFFPSLGAGGRRDKVLAGQIDISYLPVRMIVLGVSYRYEKRDSNQARLQYDDKIASASVTVQFE
jgi:Putative beta-barrel porin 2